jgi:hypothetical protein
MPLALVKTVLTIKKTGEMEYFSWAIPGRTNPAVYWWTLQLDK